MAGYLKEVNIKSDMPASAEALRRIKDSIYSAKRFGAGALKIIHGYGSTGRGGKIRTEARKFLAEEKKNGRIRDYIPGEDFSIFSDNTRRAFALCPELRRDKDLDAYNNGVTIIII